MRELRQKAYNTTIWRKIRLTYLKNHPICEECLAKGKVTPATSVHHIKSPFKGGEINYTLLQDYSNLEAVCHECHAEIHNKEQGHISPEDVLKQLDDLFNENIKDEDLE
jgi:5-methylcytosine-specific restriction protein A